MKAKVALLGTLIGAVGLVGFGSDANALTRHWKSTACGPSATLVRHSRFGFVQDPGVRVRHSRTLIRERGEARIGIRERSERFGVRERGERFGVREHGRAGISANINVRERSGERSGVQAQTNRAGAGTGANVNTGRSASPGGNTASQTSSGGAAARGTSPANSPSGGSAGGASSSMGGTSSSSTK